MLGVAGTLCKGEVQGTYAMKLQNCMQCDFYKQVVRDEGGDFMSGHEILEKLVKK
jgi:hypothetical protein